MKVGKGFKKSAITIAVYQREAGTSEVLLGERCIIAPPLWNSIHILYAEKNI